MLNVYMYRSGWLVCILCLSVAAGGCRERHPEPDVMTVQKTEETEVARPAPVVADETAAERRELQRLRKEAGILERRTAELEREVAELEETKRRLVEQFQGIEMAETMAGAGTPMREGVLGKSLDEDPAGNVFLWDKPGGHAAGARVAGQARAGTRVVVAEETVAAGKRWSRVFTARGTVSGFGWIPSDLVSETPGLAQQD